MNRRPDNLNAIVPRLRAQALGTPDAQALVVDGQDFTYATLFQMVESCASGLFDRGCRPGDAIAVALGNSLDFVVVALATFSIGGVFVPLNPRFKLDELRQYLGSCRPKAVFSSTALDQIVGQLGVAIPIQARGWADLANQEVRALLPEVDPHAPAMYMFSSGSTGASKRVTRSQAQLLAEFGALATTVHLSPRDRVLCTVPLYHAHGFGNAMMAALMSGGTLIVPSAEFNPRATMNLLMEQGVSIYPSVPFMLKMLGESRFDQPPDLKSLRLVITAGAPLPEAVHQKILERFGVPVSQIYGSTETGAMTINYLQATAKPRSVGRPLAGYQVQVRAEDGAPAACGESGEVWFRGESMTGGYDGLPSETAEAFVDGWFFAGDVGYLDEDGDLYISGRKKLTINVAGYKVDPVEVEAVLSQHPNVADVVVLGVQHLGTGERVKAVVVPRSQAKGSDIELIDFATSRLAPHKVPKLIEFRDEIPRSPLGKVLRKYLLNVEPATN